MLINHCSQTQELMWYLKQNKQECFLERSQQQLQSGLISGLSGHMTPDSINQRGYRKHWRTHQDRNVHRCVSTAQVITGSRVQHVCTVVFDLLWGIWYHNFRWADGAEHLLLTLGCYSLPHPYALCVCRDIITILSEPIRYKLWRREPWGEITHAHHFLLVTWGDRS